MTVRRFKTRGGESRIRDAQGGFTVRPNNHQDMRLLRRVPYATEIGPGLFFVRQLNLQLFENDFSR